MDSSSFGVKFVEAFVKTTNLYQLTEEEKQFTFRFFVRFKTLNTEINELMVKEFGHFPKTDQEKAMAVAHLTSIYGSPPLTKELLTGIHRYPRQDIIVNAIKGIIVLTFSSRMSGYLLDNLNLDINRRRVLLIKYTGEN